MKHKIYEEILKSIGWFDTGSAEADRFDESFSAIYPPLPTIDSETIVAYYTGCFAEFHSGHTYVVYESLRRLYRIFPSSKIVFVIAPANADYTFEKYGDIEQASNKYRFDKISKAFEGVEDVYIDLNPMLNYDSDHNFPDLIEHFLNRYDLSLDTMVEAPFIVSGKDRGNLGLISQFTEKLRAIYIDGDEMSSSSIIKENPLPRKKKKLILRCKNQSEYDLFCEYFSDQYESIESVYLRHEEYFTKRLIEEQKPSVTICKNYAGLLPYVRLSRKWINPLKQSDSFFCEDIDRLTGKVVLDSDIFSGSTKRFIESIGSSLIVHEELECDDTMEIIDYDDFLTGNWQYPYVDISYRCSMQPFNRDMHDKFRKFILEAKYGN